MKNVRREEKAIKDFLYEQLLKREHWLRDLKQNLETSIQNAPLGNLKIINCRGVEQYYLDSGTYLFHPFSVSTCISLLLAHTYFIFFLISHVFSYFWHIPISSFLFFRMYSFASGTYLFHLFSFFACIPLPLAHT